MIKDFDDELYTQLLPYVTVYGNGFINLNCASKPVLIAYAAACDSGNRAGEIYESLAAKISDFQKSGNVFDDPSEIKKQLKEFADLSSDENVVWNSMVGGDVYISSSAFRGISSGVVADGESPEVSVEFVFDTVKGTFVYWHEMQ